MKEIKLKPCPFCGGKDMSITKENVFYELQGRYGGAAIKIRCLNCNVEMLEHSRFEHDYRKRVEQAVEKWNRRKYNVKVEPVEHGKWIRSGGDRYPVYTCSECGYDSNMGMPHCANCGAKMDGGNKIG